MAQAIVNPDELRRFAAALKAFNAQLDGSTKSLKASFSQLGDTWRDQEHHKFAQEFVQTMQVLQHFMATANEQIPFLLQKAQKADDYLQHRH
jgi:uncharacterized protein YukE